MGDHFTKGKTLTATFTEKGLAKNQVWCVSLDNATQCTAKTSQKFVNLTQSGGVGGYGNYSYALLSPLGGQHITAAIGKSPAPTSGILYLPVSQTVAYTFVYYYTVTFTETGLPTSPPWAWSVTIGKTMLSNASGQPIVFALANGTYSYKATASFTGWTSSGLPKKAVVNGAATTVAVTFTKKAPVPHAGGMVSLAAGAVRVLAAEVGAESALVASVVATGVLGMLGAALVLARTGRRPGDEDRS